MLIIVAVTSRALPAVNGQEKTLISLEKIHPNKVLVFDVTDRSSRYSDVAEMRSAVDGRYQIAYTTKVRYMRTPQGNGGIGRTLRVCFNNIKTDVPLFVMFRALGVESDRRIVQLCVYDMEDTDMIELVKPSLEEGLQALSTEKALEWISKQLNVTTVLANAPEEERQAYRMKMVKSWLVRFFLPHVGDDLEKKAAHLGYMVNRLLQCVLGRESYSDRDSFTAKKARTAPIPRSFVPFCPLHLHHVLECAREPDPVPCSRRWTRPDPSSPSFFRRTSARR